MNVMKKMILGIMAIVLLVSCNDDRDNNYNDSKTDIATVENSENATKFYLKLDNDKVLYTSISELKYYRPKDGQRIIANYRVLSSTNDTSLVQLLDVYEVLTKDVYKIKPEEQDSIGDDKINIRNIWIGSDYLNVEFDYPGYDMIHFINLVSDSTKTYNDDKVHLEFRHNDNGDYPSYAKWGMASFRLSYLKSIASADSVNIVIHANVYGSSTKQTYERTYKWNSAMNVSPQKIVFRKSSEKAE